MKFDAEPTRFLLGWSIIKANIGCVATAEVTSYISGVTEQSGEEPVGITHKAQTVSSVQHLNSACTTNTYCSRQ